MSFVQNYGVRDPVIDSDESDDLMYILEPAYEDLYDELKSIDDKEIEELVEWYKENMEDK